VANAATPGTVISFDTPIANPTDFISWTVPEDWDSSNNAIELIGAGGNGAAGNITSSGGGGGGGAYAKSANVVLAPGAILHVHVGAAGSQDPTWVSDDQGNILAEASSGTNGLNNSTTTKFGSIIFNAPGGSGGMASTSVGNIVYPGGAGGQGLNGGAGAGGGSAGPIGRGQSGGGNTSGGGTNLSALGGGGSDGGLSTSGQGSGGKGTGGNGWLGSGGGNGSHTSGIPGGNGVLGGGGGGGFVDNSTPNITSPGGNGGSDAVFDSGHGAGGGGGGGGGHQSPVNGAQIGAAGGNGGSYGGGGGGGGGASITGGAGGLGAGGLVIIHYGGDNTPPSTPGMLSTTILTSTKITLNWSASTDDTSSTTYRIYRNNVWIASVLAPSFTQVSPAITAASTYAYAVIAADASGNVSDPTVPFVVTIPGADKTAPTAPTGLTATKSLSQVTLSWDASTDNVAVVGYYIYRNNVLVSSTTATSYSDLTVVQGASYTYYIKAIDAAGNLSTSSKQISLTMPQMLSIIINSILTSTTSPTLAKATITWSAWEATQGIVSYGLSPAQLANIVTGTSTSHSTIINSLKRSSQYYFQISAIGTDGQTAQTPLTLFGTP